VPTFDYGWGQSATYGDPGFIPRDRPLGGNRPFPVGPGGPRALPFWQTIFPAQQVFPSGLVKRPGVLGSGLGRAAGAGALPFGWGQLAALGRGPSAGPRPGLGTRFPGGRPLPWQLGQGAASHVPTGGAAPAGGGEVPFTPMAALAAFAAQYQPQY
jgi:hypothetical protein